MHYDEFVARLRRRAGLQSSEQASEALAAILRTFGERIQSDTARNLADQLPPELAGYLIRPSDLPGERFDVDEFLGRVAERARLEYQEARRVTRAVLDVLVEAVAPGEIKHLWNELPREYLDLYAGAAPHGSRQSGAPGGGQGRRDDVSGSRVYPASARDGIPPDAVAQGMASWGQGDRGAQGYDDSGGSELVWRDNELLGGLTSGPDGRPSIDTHGDEQPEQPPKKE